MNGSVSLTGVRKVYRRSSTRGRLHSLKGALFHRQIRSAARSEEFVALDDVNLAVTPGEAVALVGPNGSGKSTALKLISGILQPTRGTVKAVGRVTALIELGAGFHPEISGRENVIINGMLLGLSRREITERLDEIVSFAGIGDFVDQPVKSYSSGMYVRLGFAVAVAVDPSILLVDEVLAVGDAAFTARCLDRLARMRREGVTMILVSHDLDLVQSFADRAVYLSRGRVIADGPPEQVVQRYVADVSGTHPRGRDDKTPAGTAKRWGNRDVEITAVDMLCGGRALRLIPSGADCRVRISYRVNRKVDDFVFGVGWHRDDGTTVAGHNTQLDGWRPQRLEGEGEVSCLYQSVDLAPGEYLLDVAIHAEDGTAYDYWCDAVLVQITSPVAWPGVWAPAHSWHGDGPRWEPPLHESSRQRDGD